MFFLLAKWGVVTLILVFCQEMLEGFVLFEKRKAISIAGFIILEPIFVFCKKPTVLKKSKISGKNSGKETCSFRMETLVITIRDDDSIKGITIRDEPVKLSLIADNMTCFIKGSSSYTNLFVTLKTFCECFGLKINNVKTEALALGNSTSLWKGRSDLPNLCNNIKILGVYFGYDAKQRDELNFRNTLKSFKKTINLWKWRGLSLLGRIQILKTFAIPKLMFRASVLPISKDLIKEADLLFTIL